MLQIEAARIDEDLLPVSIKDDQLFRTRVGNPAAHQIAKFVEREGMSAQSSSELPKHDVSTGNQSKSLCRGTSVLGPIDPNHRPVRRDLPLLLDSSRDWVDHGIFLAHYDSMNRTLPPSFACGCGVRALDVLGKPASLVPTDTTLA
jgi:hypothetical protein